MLDFLSYPGAIESLITSVLFGSFLALLGLPLILRKHAFTGIALSETAALGAAIGSLLGTPRYILPFLFVLGVLALLERLQSRRTGEDGPVAVVYLTAASIATLLVSKLPTGEADLLVMHFGNILALSSTELWVGSGLGVTGGAALLLLYKPLLAAINDPISAEAMGYRPKLVVLFYALLLALGITYGLAIFGVVLVFGYLVAPAFLVLRISETRWTWFGATIGVAIFMGTIGLVVSFAVDFPPGPFIAGLLGSVATIGWLSKR